MEVHDSEMDFRFLHCKFACQTLGEESTCVETAAKISFSWTPTKSFGHSIGNVLQVQTNGKLLREMYFGTLCFHLSLTSVPCKRLLPGLVKNTLGCTLFGVIIFLLRRASRLT